ncbi:outer membrane beta-barrel protein [Sphingobacterium detergens]|uniref:Outer membrane protein with beta-barrel domain n=1 Tax=Sphingobacterium detergens TaxID=1145106 RepID=A0A420BKP4_SPHD1|nr:outer membrane beta-barrel protein [Sphingobacterium detergens]RKE57361.1 outer membrane protein with beta-barrel domain [Sphingobacterium detergens]
MLKNLRSKSLLVVLTVLGTFVDAQENRLGLYSLELSITPLSTVHIAPFQSLIGNGSQESKHYLSGLIRGTYKYNERWSFNAGIGYSTQKVITESAIVNPELERKIYSSNLHVLEIPLEARLSFLKYFYANAGPILHFQLNSNDLVDKQTGVGVTIGVSTKVPLSQRFAVSLSPHYKMYSLIPFQSENYHDRTHIFGVEVGLVFNIRK